MLKNIFLRPRAYAYARVTGVFAFLLSQVSHLLVQWFDLLWVIVLFRYNLRFCCFFLGVWLQFDGKVTGRFVESDGSFCWKWRVVLLKMTGRFVENDGLFYWKWQVVLVKPTGCFRVNERFERRWCDTCDSKKMKLRLKRVRMRARAKMHAIRGW